MLPFVSRSVEVDSSATDTRSHGEPAAIAATSANRRFAARSPAEMMSTFDDGRLNARCSPSTPNTRDLPARRPAQITR